MGLRNKLAVCAVAGAASLAVFALNNSSQDSWIVSSKTHELPETYDEQTIYPIGDAVIFVPSGRIMFDDEDYIVKLAKRTFAMANHPVVLYSEKEIKVSKQDYDSIRLGDSGSYALRNELQDVDVPVRD